MATEQDRPAELEGLVIAALEALPDEFWARLGSVAMVVEQEPTPEQLASVGARGLFGLYQGVPRTRWGADLAALPARSRSSRARPSGLTPNPAAFARAVEETVRHEIAHHFGISDARLRELREGGKRCLRRTQHPQATPSVTQS